MAINVFISYAHEDRELRDKLAAALSSLRKQGIINDWFDGDIVPGAEWRVEIERRLNEAQIILLLISPDFISSDFCYGLELQRALARHAANEARVIPIILRPTDWEGAPFEHLEALPTHGEPVTEWKSRDKAFLDITKGIRAAIRDLQGKNSPAP